MPELSAVLQRHDSLPTSRHPFSYHSREELLDLSPKRDVLAKVLDAVGDAVPVVYHPRPEDQQNSEQSSVREHLLEECVFESLD